MGKARDHLISISILKPNADGLGPVPGGIKKQTDVIAVL